MFRTCVVRLFAMKLTLSVRSRQMPETSLTRGLSAEDALGADLARDAGDLRCERAELVEHRVHGRADAEELSAHGLSLDLEGHLLRQVALGDRVETRGDLDGRAHEIVDHQS